MAFMLLIVNSASAFTISSSTTSARDCPSASNRQTSSLEGSVCLAVVPVHVLGLVPLLHHRLLLVVTLVWEGSIEGLHQIIPLLG
eukprot:1545734-Rhodomonas_salina.2